MFENHRKVSKGQFEWDKNQRIIQMRQCEDWFVSLPMNRAIKSLCNSHTGKYAFLYLLYVYDCESMGSLGCRIHYCGQLCYYLKLKLCKMEIASFIFGCGAHFLVYDWTFRFGSVVWSNQQFGEVRWGSVVRSKEVLPNRTATKLFTI